MDHAPDANVDSGDERGKSKGEQRRKSKENQKEAEKEMMEERDVKERDEQGHKVEGSYLGHDSDKDVGEELKRLLQDQSEVREENKTKKRNRMDRILV